MSNMEKKKTREELANEQRLRDIEQLRNSYFMYEDSKADVVKKTKTTKDKYGNRMYSDSFRDTTLELIDTMQEDVYNQYIQLGGDPEELKNRPKKRGANKKKLTELLKKINDGEEEKDNMSELLDKLGIDATNVTEYMKEKFKSNKTVIEETDEDENDEDDTNKENVKYVPEFKENTAQKKSKYDLIPLPSNGECYSSKIREIPVAYMTAYDENLILSPNLYKNDMFLDYLLKAKVMTNQIDPNDMLKGDRDAIVLFLRATSYGNLYPITVTDKYGVSFDTVADLTKIKYKPFKLKGDKNGYFSFTLPVSGDNIKFKFLTYGENKVLTRLVEGDNVKIKKGNLSKIIDELSDYLENDEEIDKKLKIKLNTAIGSITEYSDSLEENDEAMILHAATNHLEMSIMAVNEVTDRDYIHEYVKEMPVRDSSALRKYIAENEPGLDFNIEVERPESLGGGSETTFLRLDQFLFLNTNE